MFGATQTLQSCFCQFALRPTLKSPKIMTHRYSALRFAATVAMALSAGRTLTAQATKPAADPYLWLEDVSGARSMAWVKAENSKTTNVLEKDPRFAGFYKSSLGMAQATDRIPGVSFIGDKLYNFWQDSTHVRGIWRSTTLASYRSATPQWTTVLDLDAIARTEKANWVWQGADCVQPAQQRCLLNLSDGGEDAVTVREFDLSTHAFVPNGFNLPKGKQNVAWMGSDTLLVAREWVKGEMTASGYPFVLKRVARGQTLDKAVEIFRGKKSDVLVAPLTLDDGSAHRVSVVARLITFFETEQYIIRPTDVARLAMPAKASLVSMIDGQLVAQLSEQWKSGATTIKSGALAAFAMTTALSTPNALAPVPIVEPGPRESVAGAAATQHRLLVGMTDNVKGRVYAYTRTGNGAWTRKLIALPDNATTGLSSADTHSEQAMISVTGFLTPSSVWFTDAAQGTATTIKSAPARFDASQKCCRPI